jgi:hypothetical protein
MARERRCWEDEDGNDGGCFDWHVSFLGYKIQIHTGIISLVVALVGGVRASNCYADAP